VSFEVFIYTFYAGFGIIVLLKADCNMKKILQTVLSVLLLAAGITLMISGIIREEPQTILQKAVVVCLECIGIG